MPPEPRCTYRLQLGPGLDLDQAAALVPYLAELGVSHLYASPYLQAAKGSTHGYDVVDPTRVNTELGGEAAHQRRSSPPSPSPVTDCRGPMPPAAPRSGTATRR